VASYRDENANRAQYYANVTNIDLAVGRLLATLDELKLADNTLVFFTSDNGPETLLRYPNADRSYGSPGPLRGMKLHLYEGGIRVPGITRWPGRIQPGKVSDEPISSVDLLPTFSAAGGAEPPKDRPLDGTNLLPLFEGRPIARETPLFWFYALALQRPRMAMRDGDYKLCALWDVSAGSIKGPADPQTVAAIKSAKLVEFELYNLREDIGEKNDLAAREPQRVRKMAARAAGLFDQIQRECPVWKPVTTRPR
jgi:arylsulfatase A